MTELGQMGVADSINGFSNKLRQYISEKSTVAAPGDFGVPYPTNNTINGRIVWAVRMDFGALPNATQKMILLPNEVINNWGSVNERWIDTSQSYVYYTDPNNGEEYSYPLPYATMIQTINEGWFGSISGVNSDQIAIALNSDHIRIVTESDRSETKAIATIKYLKASGS